jgi:DnaA family protein
MTGAQRRAQLALAFQWNDRADLASFVPRGNEQAVAAIRSLGNGNPQGLYLMGAGDSGKSHLLQAACGEVTQKTGQAVYLPLAQLAGQSPSLLEGLDQLALVAIDDLTAVAGDQGWEEGLFHLYNRLRDRGGQLVVGARQAPAGLGLQLPDLTSRLEAMLRLRLSAPDDPRRRLILKGLLGQRGLTLPEPSMDYLLRHQSRDLSHLLTVVERLDAASLQAGRRLTVPFIREVLGPSD